MSYGFPPPAQQPPSWGSPPQPAPSRGGFKFFVVGCLLFIIIGIAVACGAIFFAGRAVVGSEVATTNIGPSVPFLLTYTQHGDGAVWLAIDASNPQGVQLNGMINATINGAPAGTWPLSATLSGGCTNPVAGQGGSACMNWTNNSFSGSVSGKTRMFQLPMRTNGASVVLNGVINLTPGSAVRELRVLVRE